MKHSVEQKESSVERALVRSVQAIGGVCLKWTCPGRNGAPDRIILTPDGRVEFVEVKSASGKPSAAQLAFHRTLAAMGHPVTIVRDRKTIDELIDRLRSP